MKILLALIMSLSFVACGALRKPSEPTFNQKMLKVQEERMKAGEDLSAQQDATPTADTVQASLWAKSGGSPYIIRNQRAQKVGDLLTIVIVEDAKATAGAKTDAKRDGSNNLGLTVGAGQGASTQLGTLSGVMNNKNNFKGEGQTNRSGTFNATVQAVVENVLPTGTLYIRGKKKININNEDQDVEISGFVRPDDIRINNTVISTLLADASIRYSGEGVVSDKQYTGWGTRLLDSIWPF
ncbi:MAG: flagellar basal body L-ring protein FlgH [Deltaproteobacteria bacterium]|nr:flagellar basal body L-ring protein FlgH [Deltaproteobacteria bacterium]